MEEMHDIIFQVSKANRGKDGGEVRLKNKYLIEMDNDKTCPMCAPAIDNPQVHHNSCCVVNLIDCDGDLVDRPDGCPLVTVKPLYDNMRTHIRNIDKMVRLFK